MMFVLELQMNIEVYSIVGFWDVGLSENRVYSQL